jgi:hypothetical protein
MKEEVFPLCEVVCEKYQILVLFLSTKSGSAETVGELIKMTRVALQNDKGEVVV